MSVRKSGMKSYCLLQCLYLVSGAAELCVSRSEAEIAIVETRIVCIRLSLDCLLIWFNSFFILSHHYIGYRHASVRARLGSVFLYCLLVRAQSLFVAPQFGERNPEVNLRLRLMWVYANCVLQSVYCASILL